MSAWPNQVVIEQHHAKGVELFQAGSLDLAKQEFMAVSWSGESKIAKVVVGADEENVGAKQSCKPAAGYEWTQWRSQINLTRSGVTDLVCRATDEKGSTQPAERDPERRDGYACNWYHYVRCVVV